MQSVPSLPITPETETKAGDDCEEDHSDDSDNPVFRPAIFGAVGLSSDQMRRMWEKNSSRCERKIPDSRQESDDGVREPTLRDVAQSPSMQ